MDEHIDLEGRGLRRNKDICRECIGSTKKLDEMTYEDLVKTSKIWKNEKPVSIECVDTTLGLFDQETWEEIFKE